MHIRFQHLLFAALVISLVSLAYGINYLYYSDTEQTRFNDRIKWFVGDTLGGPIRTNEMFSIMESPQFYDFVISSAPDFWHGTGYNPGFNHGMPPVFNAPRLEMPTSANWLRQQAVSQGTYYEHGDTMRAKVHINSNQLQIWWGPLDGAIDSTDTHLLALTDSAVVFFDTPKLDLWGTVSTNLVIGTSGRAGLADNLIYASSDVANGRLAPNHTEKFALVAEGDVKILNTPANGRENSAGLGLSQTNLDSTGIALNGLYYSLGGSFTFDQQNDADSGYVYRVNGQIARDDRGTIYLWGALANRQRGYVHRSSNYSTGYLKQYRYDNMLRYWNVGVFNVRENVVEPSAVDFGSVPVGETVRDTVQFINDYVPVRVDSSHAPESFAVGEVSDSFQWSYPVPLSFTPTHTGTFADTVRLYSGYYDRWISVPVSGTGMENLTGASDFIPHPSSLILSSSPNPFNAQTRITFALPKAGMVSLAVFDVLGRKMKMLVDGNRAAGEYTVPFNASALPTGVYFVRLQSASGAKMEKLLLLK